MPAITLQVDTSRALAAFSRMREAVASGTENSAIKAGMEDAANVYLGFVRRRFSAASGSPGAPWADLAPITKYNRLRRMGAKFPKKKGFNRLAFAAGVQLPILYDTGNLYNSLVPGEPGYFEQWNAAGVDVGSTVFYGRFHQNGGGRLPARPIMVGPDAYALESIKRGEAAGLKTAIVEAAGN